MDFECVTLEDWHKICKKKTLKNTGRCLQLYSLERQTDVLPRCPLEYKGHTDIGGVHIDGYVCLGHTDVWVVYGHMEDIQTYRGVWTWRHTDVWGCTDI